jgi:hypothetical protein
VLESTSDEELGLGSSVLDSTVEEELGLGSGVLKGLSGKETVEEVGLTSVVLD